ncbi:MAG: IMP dehydrogenase [Saccharofermentans sp.]|nr:IMP dehydrogenase [Clostridiales bacterium]MBR4494209.1 IMP dehydrogenase [Clostridiales bacterium]MCR5049446.1 IMP dehydrogenase [Saccharofermentans sp.]
MATIFEQESRTFSEYLLVPNLTTEKNTPDQVDLSAPVCKYRKGQEESKLKINIPVVSAVMQAVSDDGMAIALARCGGMSFIFQSQSIESQCEMIRKVKKYKAGIVASDSNVSPDATLEDILKLREEKEHGTVAVTEDGTAEGKLLGLVTTRDYRVSRMSLDEKVSTFMTPIEKLVTAPEGTTLKVANDIIWDNKINQLPIIDKDGRLVGLVFRKDYEFHKANPYELLDSDKKLIVGAGINTRDYEERVPALIEAGADALCLDSSDGFSVWQQKALTWIKSNYPDVIVGAGNVVDAEGFKFLADCGADFIKIGIGGGSICITREQKGIGCGQASAVLAVSEARDKYFKETGVYIPLCSDGGIVHDYHMALALAMGADFMMLGRYFARFDESPTRKLLVGGTYVKEYWGEGSNRARNWQRYDDGGKGGKMAFEEGVDSYVPYAGKLKDNLDTSLAKVKATMCSCGSSSIEEFQQKARLVVVSSTSIIEGGAHDVIQKENDRTAR